VADPKVNWKISLLGNLTYCTYFSQVFDDPKVVAKYYAQLGQHFASNQEYSTAEQLYVKAGMYKEAIDMYNEAGKTLSYLLKVAHFY
jgi:hypothetical protein